MRKNALMEASTCPLCGGPKTRGHKTCEKCLATVLWHGNKFAELEIERAKDLAQMEQERMI